MEAQNACLSIDEVRGVSDALRGSLDSVIEGKPDAVALTIMTLLAGGHLLIEDVPGTGKTLLAKSLARAVGATSSRVQFTPDLLPSDITGASIFHQGTREFEFRPGAVFTNVLLADEINRASSKTQSALLEAMEERAVTVDGKTHALQDPFMVIATSNPVEMDGTYDLPEAQRDRFLVTMSMGYPSASAEVRMLAAQTGHGQASRARTVTDVNTVRAAIAAVGHVHASHDAFEYTVALARATRARSELTLGVSPRASVHLIRVAKAHAAMQGRDHVLPRDIQFVLPHVWGHRVHLTPAAVASGVTTAQVLRSVVDTTPVTGGPGAGRGGTDRA